MTITNKKLLAFTGAFVPFNDTVTLMSYKHLRVLDHQVDVVALHGKEDDSIVEELKNDPYYQKFNILYVASYDKTITGLSNKNVVMGIYNIIKYIKGCLKQFDKENYNIIYSSSIPSFTHLAAYIIKLKHKDVHWIAAFSDPLINSPYKKDDERIKEYNPIIRFGFFLYIFIYMNDIYEKIAMKHADKLVFISEQQRLFMLNNAKVKETANLIAKTTVVPLTYIKEWMVYQKLLANSSRSKKQYPLIAAHFGRIYGLRKIDVFINALIRLKYKIPNLHQFIVFHFYGEVSERYLKRIKEENLESLFMFYDKVSYAEANDKMINCDILLLFDTITNKGEQQPFLPSKTLEYLLLRKPILALTQNNSPAFELLQSYGHNFCTDKSDEMITYIMTLIKDLPSYNYDVSNLDNENVEKIV
ncbi:MAG: hypothetical protein VB009_01235 [Erysipelotrichaceae bacterium]|nr:hypothetical protein [Erysipelotrichaceae bacterium]